ncbi:hypothetical protein [Beggiatoa leptomitoformis]|uniref:Uncharacterized protein n=1 Tax=Beggiatoa leptomitoformis TaxID=288004 RepID=A0A2N9YG36_9GAMM|nr:hypothetical protein [Beggiatoa leptomitoformis]AUI69472.1 hypothetical protein BLE401_12775 [Beggiatoa leptomitoformis]QGX03708.1 hypothetical protein AL038_19060 [Beggiatoa leptomitoformis]
MLRELLIIQQDTPDKRKRWFEDSYFDLFVWQDTQTGEITSFQLCYDRAGTERVISWEQYRGFEHQGIDDGETSPHKNMTPVFIRCNLAIPLALPAHFQLASQCIDTLVRSFIRKKLEEYQSLTNK